MGWRWGWGWDRGEWVGDGGGGGGRGEWVGGGGGVGGLSMCIVYKLQHDTRHIVLYTVIV